MGHVTWTYSERIPALLGHVMSRGTVALPSVAWYFHPMSFTVTASTAAPISALRRRSTDVGPACAVSPCTSTCMPRTAYRRTAEACQSVDVQRRSPQSSRIPQRPEPASNQAPPDGARRAIAKAALKTLRASAVLASLTRIASAFSIPQAESVPASSPAQSGAPGSDRTPRQTPTAGRRLRRSLNAAVAEGAFAEIFAACASGAVITGWALYLGASAAIIGLLGALPLGAQVASLPAAWFTSARSRKTVALWAVGISRLTFLPLLALPTLDAGRATKLHLFLGVVAISTVASVIGNSAWVAWMGDLVPDRLRGRFFGRRMVFLSIAGTLTSLAAAILLDRLAPIGWTGAALSTLTAAAFLAGVVLMLRQHEPPVAVEAHISAWQALGLTLRDWRVRPFLGYLFAWNAAVGISASFFAYH